MTAPIVALTMAPMIPAPKKTPKKERSHPPKNAPMTPTTMSPSRPNPPPLTTTPAKKPATAPMMSQTTKVSMGMTFLPSFESSVQSGQLRPADRSRSTSSSGGNNDHGDAGAIPRTSNDDGDGRDRDDRRQCRHERRLRGHQRARPRQRRHSPRSLLAGSMRKQMRSVFSWKSPRSLGE